MGQGIWYRTEITKIKRGQGMKKGMLVVNIKK